jgi:hypothetical protein
MAGEYAAAALADLATLPACREHIVQSGAIIHLVALLHTGSNRATAAAAAAIAGLARGHAHVAAQSHNTSNPIAALAAAGLAKRQADAASQIAEAGAITHLVALLRGERGDAAQEEAAGALYVAKRPRAQP